MTHRTGHTDNPVTEAPGTAAEARQSEAPRTTPEPRYDPAPGTTSEPQAAARARHTTAPGTGGTRTPAPGTGEARTPAPGRDSKQVTNRGPGDMAVPPAPRTAPAAAPSDRRAGRPEATSAGLPLLPVEEQDSLTRRMQQAVSDFVETPRQAVEEAESTFDRIVADLTEALEERRHVLRSSWQSQDTEARTEELRVALQQYRDVGERLLRI